MNNGKKSGLIIPINVVAFCVSEIDESETTGRFFAGATTIHDKQKVTGVYLGADITHSLTESAYYNKLKKGIHLHWALPDALTRSLMVEEGDDEGYHKFPAIPNRWLLTRLYIDNNKKVETRSWIIESDSLNEKAPNLPDMDASMSVTTLVKVIDGESENLKFRYLGKWSELNGDWVSTDYKFSDYAGDELTSVTSGEFSFAAYYPDCNTVLGFWDRLEDLEEMGNSQFQLMYVVTGWYDNPKNDPLNNLPEKDKATIIENLKWTFEGDGIPDYTVYSGLVENIVWERDPNTRYIKLINNNQIPPINNATVVIGNNQAEVFSAYFREILQIKDSFIEPWLNAFQMGLVDNIDEQDPDKLRKIYDSLHEKRFITSNAGTIYTITKKSDDEEVLIDLPPKLADDLNRLNIERQKLDQVESKINEYLWQLFSDWYRIFAALASGTYSDTQAYNNAIERYRNYGKLNAKRVAQKQIFEEQCKIVRGQMPIGGNLILKPIAAPRYYQPAEPVVLIRSPDLKYPSRYGGDGQFDKENGCLRCRLDDSIMSEVTINEKTSIPIEKFDYLSIPSPKNLPYSDVCSKLLKESCLLNTSLVAALTNSNENDLRKALDCLLKAKAIDCSEKSDQKIYQVTGCPPSPIEVTYWDGNPWLPIFLCWNADYHPLQSTKNADYSSDFFANNFHITVDENGAIIGPDFDSKRLTSQIYKGEALLQPNPSYRLRDQLEEYLKHKNEDDNGIKILKEIFDILELESSEILVQPLSGLNYDFIDRQQTIQCDIKVNQDDFDDGITRLTGRIAKEVTDQNSMGPQFSGDFNPIRAGYLELNSLQVVDIFGQTRAIDVTGKKVVCAQSMIAHDQDKNPVDAVAYMEPRISQPSRLPFRWISANSTGYEEMNSHPATSPICGWILLNHLNKGLFINNQNGKPLGSLYLKGDHVEWQSAPGDNRIIDWKVNDVLAYENAQLGKFVLNLMTYNRESFEAFYKAVDAQQGSINPQNLSCNSSLALLVGSPIALVQALLRLELEGSPALNQHWDNFVNNIETDNKFSDVKFPVILGDISQLNDGLIGYYKTLDSNKNDYDLSKFYIESIDPTKQSSALVYPEEDNILLTIAQKQYDPENPDDNLEAYTQKLLMLVDPRGSVHAATGILPTKSLDLPSYLVDSALSILEMCFPVNPILEGKAYLCMPTPQEAGYQFSWIEEDMTTTEDGIKKNWTVRPDIQSSIDKGIWSYTPQRISEGWLRMNPILLEFNLIDDKGCPVVTNGVPNSLTLRITNKKGSKINFHKDEATEDGSAINGSTFYIRLGDLMKQIDIDKIELSAEQWIFKIQNDAKQGVYWAAEPKVDFSLDSEESTDISITGILVSTDSDQARVYFDYYNIDGLNDGVYSCLIAVKPLVKSEIEKIRKLEG